MYARDAAVWLWKKVICANRQLSNDGSESDSTPAIAKIRLFKLMLAYAKKMNPVLEMLLSFHT
jgi:hypothetical protein